jgi:hypothetical protein
MAFHNIFPNTNNNSSDEPTERIIPTVLLNFHGPQKEKTMALGYKPTSFDVCCGRGKQHWKHSGNVNFRKFIKNNIHLYLSAETKPAKTNVVVSLVEHVRENGGHFLKLEEDTSSDNFGCWVDIGDFLARDKVSHSLRDQINHQARRKCKVARNQQQQSNHEQQLLKAQEKASLERMQKPSILELQYDNLPQYVAFPAPLPCSEVHSPPLPDTGVMQALPTPHELSNYDSRHGQESFWRPVDEEQADRECQRHESLWKCYDYDAYFGACAPTDGANLPVQVFEM